MEKIRGFTIELDLDSIKVDSGLKDMKSSMRQMNSEMRRNMSAFDFGEKSLEKYGTQLDGLNKKLELQKKTTESARKHYEKMVAEHGEGSRQAQEAAATYNNEAAQLNNLERHINKVTDEMKAFKREQEIQSSTMWKTGDALEGFGKGLGEVSKKAREIGGNLTKWITLPAMGVVTTVGGITAAFGWGRLKSVDAAQAQLKGLGYEAEDVERISGQLSEALEGGMLTMGEATSAAATAMAAGVKEGEELTRYIQILDGTVAGSTGTFEEMEQIFGRIVDQGNMTRNEFDMIAQRMPGFSKAVQENMNVSSDEMYEMLRNGKITTDQFLDIMEDFSGDMATEYAKSWDGMVMNTKAYIGIIGENLLGGVFEKSKESIAEFIEILSSDAMISWAEEMGKKIGDMFTVVVDKIKDGITWFRNLSNSQQEMIVKFGAIVLAAGPLITGLGIFGGVIAKISTGLGVFLKFLAPVTKGFGLFSGTSEKAGKAVGKAGKSVGLLSRVFTFLTGPVGIAIGIITVLTTAFVTAYKKSETFRNFIHDLGEKIREVFLKIVDWIQPGLDAVINFFGDIKEKITDFWVTDGQNFIEAWQNISNFIKPIVDGIWDRIKWAFEQIKWIIADYVMPVIEFIIKQVWGNIKGIITGALDVIMGAVKIFSGLFTGDFSKMWEGVKQLFFGAIKVIWNWLELQFIGRILKGVGGLASGFWGHIKNLWKWVKDTFTNSISTVYNGVRESFVGRIVRAIIDFAKNFRTNISNMWNTVKKNFTTKISEIRTAISNSFVGRMLESVKKLKTNFIDLAKDMWSGVKKQFNNIVDGAKGLPKRIGDGIRNAKDKAVSGMKSVGNSIIRWAGKPFNKVVDGVNWITGKLGITEKIDPWAYPQYAKGTDGHPGGPAVLGDGKGSNAGREFVGLPDGRSFLSANKPTLYPDLPKGTQVLPAKLTKQIPMYAEGKGWLSKVWGSTKSFVGKIGEAVGDVWSYISNPSKLVNKVMDGIGVIKDKAQIPTKMVTSGFDYLKTKPVEFIKNMFKKAEEESAAGPSGAGAKAWRNHILRAAARMNVSVSDAEVNGIIAQIHRESGGNQRITQSSAVWDVNMAAGNPARGLLQYIPQTFNAYKMRGHGNIYSGFDQLLAFFNNSNWRRDLPYGKRGWGPTGGRRYKRGTNYVPEDGPAFLHKGEAVIPKEFNRPVTRTEAMKLVALAAKKIGVEGGSYTRPSNLASPPQEKENSYFQKLLAATLQQNQILMQLLQKDSNFIINDRVLATEIEPVVTEIQERNRGINNAFKTKRM